MTDINAPIDLCEAREAAIIGLQQLAPGFINREQASHAAESIVMLVIATLTTTLGEENKDE